MPEWEKAQKKTGTAPAAQRNGLKAIRRHIPGPVFSLAFHILLLGLLGALVVIAPDAIQDVTAPVQIKELKPATLPPEEEPVPNDATLFPLLPISPDRYDSSEQQQMDEVGVTDIRIMPNVDILSPVTVPDSLSSLRLQDVLPFGRPGGAGRRGSGTAEADKEDEGEEDRASLNGMLQGVFYDLKQTKNRRPTEAMGDPQKPTDYTRDRILPVLKDFINGNWHREYDKQGRVHYPELDKYYCSPTRLWNSCFYTEQINAAEAPAAFECGREVSTGGWVCIYSGDVVAPFTGKFRFVGYGDDILLIRFNSQIVFDYGWYSATLAENLGRMGDFHSILAGHPENERQRRMIEDSVIYSKHMLDLYFPSFDSGHGIAKGPVLEVQAGEVYPLEIMISEVPGGSFSMVLFVEQLDGNGQPVEPNPDLLTLFRTTLDLPKQPRQRDFPRFKPYGPIWRVVRSMASDSGSSSGSTSGSGILGTRNSPRKELITEDDEDLSL